MDVTQERGTALAAISNEMVRLHKEQFGRGPTEHARTSPARTRSSACYTARCYLQLKMIQLGDQHRVRDARVAFQAATSNEFVTAVEKILGRKVRAFASGVDPDANVVFESFFFEPREA